MSSGKILSLTRKVSSLCFISVGCLLTIYIAFSTFGFVNSSSVFYTNFILAIVFQSGMLSIRNLVDQYDNSKNHKVDKIFILKIVFSVVGTVLAVAGAAYIRINADRLELIQPFFENIDIIMGFIFTIGILILTLIHWGPLLTSIVAISILYFFFGNNLDSILFTIPDYDTSFIMNYLGLGTTQGFFWLAQLAADSLYFLIVYAAVLLSVGTLKMVIEVGKLAGTHVSGGAAFPALIGSGIVSSVMGQSVSNVVLTGRFTIPMMKKYGYSPAMSGAIEAVASTAGQIMPPILGLAAFMIASFLNIPYIQVALAALVPAVLFLTAVTIGVLVYGKKNSLPKLSEAINTHLIRSMLPTFVLSFSAVILLLLFYYSPSIAGMAGIIIALIVCLFQGKYRPKVADFKWAVDEGLVLVTLLSLLLIAVGPLGQIMLTTNLSGRLGSVLLEYLPDSEILLLLGAMTVSILLGMGLPTPVAYLVVALAIVPFMQQLGVEPLSAHFFVFYFAVFSCLTPPIAVSVLAAAKLADAKLLSCAACAMKLASTTFVIPFVIVYHPEILRFPNLTWEAFTPITVTIIMQFTSAIALFGYYKRRLNYSWRLIFGSISGLGFLYIVNSNAITLSVFIVSTIVALLWNYALYNFGSNTEGLQKHEV